MLSRVCLRLLSSTRSVASVEHSEWKQLQKQVYALVYDGKQSEAVSFLTDAEERNKIPEDKRIFFRLKLSAHLAATGAETMVDTLFDISHSTTPVTLSDEQFLAALMRVLNSKLITDPVAAAAAFYERIVSGGFHRKRNRDNTLGVIVAAAFTTKKSFSEVFKLYERLAAIEPPLTAQESKIRQKLHPRTIWEFIKAANIINDKPARNKALKHIEKFLATNASSLQIDCLKPISLLYDDRAIEYVDAIVVRSGAFTGNHIEYLMVVAEAAKEPKFLYNLIGYPDFFNKPELLAKVAEKTAMLYGKNDNIDGLAALGKRIVELTELPLYHLSMFKKSIHRIAHFYKCANVALPANLVDVVKKVSY